MIAPMVHAVLPVALAGAGPPLLLAALLEELLKLVVPFVFLIFWVLSQIAEAKKKAKAQPRQPAFPPLQSADKAKAALARAPGDPLREQVDTFLRRAAGAASADPNGAAVAGVEMQKAALSSPNRDTIEILLAKDPAATSRPALGSLSRTSEPLRPSGPQAPPRRARAPRPPQRAGTSGSKSVSEHVAEHVVSTVEQMRKDVSQLGERVAAVDREFDTQMHQKFDHEIGTLGDRHLESMQEQPSEAKVAAASPIAEIAALLATGDGVRQAVVLNEILRRPQERW
jgi:hypothetical protein